MMELLTNNLIEILALIITSVVGYIGVRIKNIYEKHVNDKTKQEIIKCTVEYVEQVFKELHGEEKLQKAKDKALEWLDEKGIEISETELEVLIEAFINGMNKGVK